MILILSAGDGNQKRGGIPSWTFPRGTGGHTGPPVCEHRSVQQPQMGRDGARPLQGPEQEGGGVRLGCGFRQPNSETEFGASVIGIGPYGEKGKFPQPPGPAAHSGASTPAVARDGRGSEQGSPQKEPSTSGNPSVSLRLTAPFTQGSLGTGMRIAASALRASSQ